MELGPMRFMSPTSAPVNQEPSPLAPENPYERILQMDEQQLFDYLRREIAQGEFKLYGETDVEAKLAFAGGSLADDISQLTTFHGGPFEGRTIYATPPEFAKDSEAVEFITMAGRVTNEDGDIVDLVSEAADLFYNYAYLAEHDKDQGPKGKVHKHAPDYIHLMSQVAGALGWEPLPALRVAAMKYHRRFIDKEKKDPKGEKEMMRELLYGTQLKPALIPVPTLRQVNTARGIVSSITKTTLHHRYLEVIEQKRLIAENQVFPSWPVKI